LHRKKSLIYEERITSPMPQGNDFNTRF